MRRGAKHWVGGDSCAWGLIWVFSERFTGTPGEEKDSCDIDDTGTTDTATDDCADTAADR